MTGRIRDIGQNVLQYSFQTRSGSSPSYSHIFLLMAFLEEAFIRNIIIILCINYIIIIFMADNKAVINNNCGRPQELTLLLQIHMGTQKNFFEIYSLFGHARSDIFASPGRNFSRTGKTERHVSTMFSKYIIRELQKVVCKTNEQPDQSQLL